MKWTAPLLSILLLAGAAGAQETKMHRAQAGVVDPSGWTLAESTEGRFSVYLPMKFDDFTTVEAYPAPAARTYTVRAKSGDGIAMAVTRIAYRKPGSAQEYFARFEKGEGLGVKPERVARLRVGEQPGVDLLLKRADSVRFQRVVLLESDLLMLVVDSPPKHEEAARQYASRFFATLLFDPK